MDRQGSSRHQNEKGTFQIFVFFIFFVFIVGLLCWILNKDGAAETLLSAPTGWLQQMVGDKLPQTTGFFFNSTWFRKAVHLFPTSLVRRTAQLFIIQDGG